MPRLCLLVSLLLVGCSGATTKPPAGGGPAGARSADGIVQVQPEPNPDSRVPGRGGGGVVSPVAVALSGLPVTTASIRQVRFSPDGKLLAVGNGAGQIIIIDAATRSQLTEFPAHADWTFDLAFHPDGTQLFSGGGDNSVRVWSVENWQLLDTFTDHSDDLHGVAITPDGRRLVSGGDDQQVVLRDLTTGETQVLERHEAQVTSVDVSPDNELAASSGRDQIVKIWNLREKKEVAVLRGHAEDVLQVRFSPDGKRLATAGYDGTIRLWDVGEQREIASSTKYPQRMHAVEFSTDGTSVFATSASTELIRLSTSGRPPMGIWSLPSAGTSLAVNPRGDLLAVGTLSGHIAFYDLGPESIRYNNTIQVGAPLRQPAPAPLPENGPVGYLNRHWMLISGERGDHANREIAHLAAEGDRFTLFLIESQVLDSQAERDAPQRELVRRIRDTLRAKLGARAEWIPPDEIAGFLERAALADLLCHPLEATLPRWVKEQLEIQVRSQDRATIETLNQLRADFRPTIPNDQPRGTLVDRVRVYLDGLLAVAEASGPASPP